jgi:hypothetical protein
VSGKYFPQFDTILWQFWGLNSGPRTCKAGTLPRELQLQPWTHTFDSLCVLPQEEAFDLLVTNGIVLKLFWEIAGRKLLVYILLGVI